ncbi:MAG: amidohydrolase family protein [Hyphomicrobiales bacterium]
MFLSLNRRQLLGAAAGLIALPATASAADEAETIYLGGPVLTMDDGAPRAEAVAVRAGRILAVGSKTEVEKHKGSSTRVIDLQGQTLIPGFVDPHGHVMMGGLQAMSANLLSPPDGEVLDVASLQKTLRDWAEANKEIVQGANLILGFGYDQSQLRELRPPSKDELDAVSKDIPVLIVHQSGHIAAGNSKLLEIIGYTAETPDPPGGVIQRGADGKEPNGVIEESAWFGAIPKIFRNVGPRGMEILAVAGSELWASYGYTTAQEGRSSKSIDAVLKAVAADGRIKIDVVAYPDFLNDRTYIKTAASRDYDRGFRVGGVKLTIDGSPQGFTAWRDRPYYAPVGNFPPDYVGYPSVTREQVFEAVDWAFANDVQILVHSNGEAASDLLIAALRGAVAKHGAADRRPVLIHGQFEREDQVESFVDLGVFPSLFPMHTFYWGDWHRDHTVGPANADNISPTGWYLKRRSRFSTHTDAPVAFPDTMRTLDATVTRRSRSGDIIGPTQRVDVMTALKAMTIWPAYQCFEDGAKGSIAPGKLADFVILSADPTAIDPETLDQIQVVETIKEGKSIYRRGQKKADLLRPRDILNPGLFEMFRQIHVAKVLASLPESYRTDEVRQQILESYDDCGAGLLLPDLFGVEDADRDRLARE